MQGPLQWVGRVTDARGGVTVVVDSHVHVFAAASTRFPRNLHELYPASAEALVETLLVDMEQAGVAHAVLVPLSPHDEYVRECLQRFPGRFAAIGVQQAGDFDPDVYRRRRDSTGFRGVRLFELGDPSTEHPEDLSCFPLLEELAGSGDLLWFYGDEAQMALLDRTLTALPDLTVVLNHLGIWPIAMPLDEHGRPRLAGYTNANLDAVRRLARFPRVFVLVSGLYAIAVEPSPYRGLRWITSALLDAFGPRRLLLASDFPWIRMQPGYLETIGSINAHFPGLAANDRARINGLNAADLFGFA
jgi:L-fuconolactonase